MQTESLQVESPVPRSQQALWAALFEAVQQAGLFKDDSTFAHAASRAADRAEILSAYELLHTQPGFDLEHFVRQQFALPEDPEVQAERTVPRAPHMLWGKLFEAVQHARLFKDSKTFADAAPRGDDPAAIVFDYEQQHTQPGFDLAQFVHKRFALPEHVVDDLPMTQALAPIEKHIGALWMRFLRSSDGQGSLLPLPHPYVVPGGRFREAYYWDSAFTVQALLLQGLRPIAQGMLDNFGDLVRRLGHVPNGNRSYMASRSQPPLLFRMVELLSDGDAGRYLEVLRAEYRFWMSGEAELAPGQSHRRVVRLADGSLLNRYWDDACLPRDESYHEDVETAAEAVARPAPQVWRDLRAGAESGWDFSSRWCADPDRLCTIETTSILPVDLNALLWALERSIVRGAQCVGDTWLSFEFEARAAARAAAVRRHLWNSEQHCFVDLQWCTGVQREATAAAVVPLYTGLASPAEAAAVATLVSARLLGRNGLRTTLRHSGQQWDRPNGWAPLQIMAAEGLVRYGYQALAVDLSRRWLGCIERIYQASGKLAEKYDTEADRIGGGGEYPTQDGFGWTNASYVVLQRLIEANT